MQSFLLWLIITLTIRAPLLYVGYQYFTDKDQFWGMFFVFLALAS